MQIIISYSTYLFNFNAPNGITNKQSKLVHYSTAICHPTTQIYMVFLRKSFPSINVHWSEYIYLYPRSWMRCTRIIIKTACQCFRIQLVAINVGHTTTPSHCVLCWAILCWTQPQIEPFDAWIKVSQFSWKLITDLNYTSILAFIRTLDIF